ncbi:probable apyrase 7 [Andrographis paniculata]|uniref:probable apyrase 7 n=1 Tax=Andrographis paniculata TaxID=175694 RepID=UPI0021E759F4|nr:probable apyrase 7 [Andrographis paniculata]
MVYSKLAELFSSTANRFSGQKASTPPNKSSGLPPFPTSSLNGNPFSNTKKIPMRLSSSLQDLSTYNLLDLERGNPSTGPVPPYLLQKDDGLSSFSKEKAPPGTSSRQKKWVRVICVLIGLLLIACLSFALRFLYSNWSQESSKYYVVLDCGSTGTRVYVYQASVNHDRNYNLPILLKSLPEDFQVKSGAQSGRAYSRMETEPGFDKLVRNISGLRIAIDPLVQWAQKQIPSESHKTTSLFLYATAGVRRLPSSESEWLLKNAYTILMNSPFLCKKEWIKIISGMEEAYYGWIALNYHNGVLGSLPKRETYGALDLGGSSLQVTFEGKQSGHDETSLKLSIGPVNHHLSAYSLEGYGLNDAFDKSVAHLLRRLPGISNADLAGKEVEINHPCLHSGYKARYTCSQCSSIKLEDGSSPVGVKESGKGGKVGVPLQLVGSPDWEQCRGLAKSSVNLSEWSDRSRGIDCKLHPCALPENVPRPTGQFFAMSGFYVVYRFFNLTPAASLDEVLEKGRGFCKMEWDAARKSVAPQPFIEQYCFRAPYVVILLREGLHIQDNQVSIGSGSITWTLGVALFEAGKVYPYMARFRSYNVFRVRINLFVLVAILFASLFVLLCALSCVGKGGLPKFLRRSYLPAFRHSSAASGPGLNLPAPFRFQRWSPISTGDGRAKMPLSPTVASGRPSPFDSGPGFGGGGGIQFSDSSLYSSSSGVAHSYSSGNLGQLQFDNSSLASFWAPNRTQMRLQSRRSQSREDLNSTLAEAHLAKI